jgi:hypothetical protein
MAATGRGGTLIGQFSIQNGNDGYASSAMFRSADASAVRSAGRVSSTQVTTKVEDGRAFAAAPRSTARIWAARTSLTGNPWRSGRRAILAVPASKASVGMKLLRRNSCQ